ncbi:MAG TPA: ImmA/IrrE family metallo-endopeptidase, partial [Candidatus Kapabacteria bacterium]
KSPLRATSLTAKQQRRADELSRILFECGDDIEFWCDCLGYEIHEHTSLAAGEITAVLMDGFIFLAPRLPFVRRILSIAHEIFHHEFHASVIAYRDESDKNVDLRESQAESFAVLVAEPSLLNYETMERFRFKTKLPEHLKAVRENLFYLIKR